MGSDILLLVSDCDQDAVALRAAAEDLCDLVVAADAAQCMQLLSQSPSIIIVSDRLNSATGCISDVASLCADIRKDPTGAFTPILVLADDGAFSDTDTDGVIRRPVQPAVLAAWLQAAQCMARMRLNANVAEKQDCEQLLKSFAKLSHAVNNPLQALFATVDMLLLNNGLGEEATALTSQILTHAGRVAKIVAEASGKAKEALQPATAERPTQVL